MDKKKILVVEDEKAISDILVFNLQREGYDTLAAYDGAEGLRCALEEAPDLILLDVMLPEMDGFEVCRRVRAEKDTPIIMLTAREEETDKVMGLELGADDYITKPFSMRELMARVKANMRRTYAGEDREKAEAPSGGGLRVSKDNGMVYKNGHPHEQRHCRNGRRDRNALGGVRQHYGHCGAARQERRRCGGLHRVYRGQ